MMKNIWSNIRAGLWIVFLLFSLAACSDQTPGRDDVPATQTEVYPKTPEAVVRQYQAYIDSNYFDRAQRLSTARSAPLHEMMAAIVADTPADSSLIHTEFLRIECTTEQDAAICICQLRDEYETYESEYLLVRVNGRWQVDLPEDQGEINMDEDELLEPWPIQE